MEENEKKVVIKENSYKNNFMNMAFIVLFPLLIFLILFCLIATGEMILLLPLFVFLVLGAIVFICGYVIRKKCVEYVFTPVYFVRLKNGKEEIRVYWETVGALNVEIGIQDRLYGIKPKLIFSSETIRNGKFDIQNYFLYCSEEELFSIQEIIPVMIADGKYCSGKRKEEIESLREKIKTYEEDPLFDISIRGRAAYLICCLENALLKFGRMEEWRERLKTLWLFTSCIGDEKEKIELEEAIAKYQEKYEAFPEFVSHWTDNFITFEEWREQATFRFPKADEKSEVELQDYIFDRILQTIYRVSAHTPEKDSYGYDSVQCQVTLDEVHGLNEVLRRYGIPLPMPEFYATQLYRLYDDGTRDPCFGIGLPFNGLVTYSVLGAEERKERVQAAQNGAAQIEVQSSQDVYDWLNEALSPVLDKSKKEEPVFRLRLPKDIRMSFVVGGALSVFFLIAGILRFFYAKSEIEFLCLLFGGVADIFLFRAFLKKRLLYESQYQPYPLKFLDFLLLLALSAVNIALAVYTFSHIDEIKLFGGPCIAVFIVAGAAYFSEWIELCSMRNLYLVAFNSKADYDKPKEEPVKRKEKLTVREICGTALAALNTIFFFVYYSQSGNFFPFAFISIMTGAIGVFLLNRAVTVARDCESKGKKLFLRIILFFFLALTFIVDYIQGMRTGSIQPIDMAVIFFFVVLTVAYIVLLIRTFIRKKGETGK